MKEHRNFRLSGCQILRFPALLKKEVFISFNKDGRLYSQHKVKEIGYRLMMSELNLIYAKSTDIS